MTPGPAEGRVGALLEPFAADLLPGAIEGYALPVADGGEANRADIRTAARLLEEAGWRVVDGVLRNAAGEAFSFEVLLVQGASEVQSIVNIYAEALARLGIEVRLTAVDNAQYTERRNAYDFDMTHYMVSLSLSPGNEQWLYWGSEAADTPGTRNLMGVKSPAIDAMIGALLTSASREDFVAAVQALDRVLTSGRYVIPFWYSDVSRLAHDRRLHFPERLPMYGDWIGFLPELWWYEE